MTIEQDKCTTRLLAEIKRAVSSTINLNGVAGLTGDLDPNLALDRVARLMPVAGLTGADLRDPSRLIGRATWSVPIAGLSDLDNPLLRAPVPLHPNISMFDPDEVEPLNLGRMLDKMLERIHAREHGTQPIGSTRSVQARSHRPGARPFRSRHGRRRIGF